MSLNMLDTTLTRGVVIVSRDDHNESKSLSTTQLLSRLDTADDSPRQHAGNLHHSELSAFTIRNVQGILFVALTRLAFVRRNKLTWRIFYFLDFPFNRRTINVNIQRRQENADSSDRLRKG